MAEVPVRRKLLDGGDLSVSLRHSGVDSDLGWFGLYTLTGIKVYHTKF